MITVFAFLVLSQLVARVCRSQRIFLGEHPCFVLEWTCGCMASCWSVLCLPLLVFLFLGAEELHFAYQKVYR